MPTALAPLAHVIIECIIRYGILYRAVQYPKYACLAVAQKVQPQGTGAAAMLRSALT